MYVLAYSPEQVASELSEQDLVDLDRNIVLWGTPTTNRHLAQLFDGTAATSHATRPPLSWEADNALLTVGPATFPAASHVPLLIYPSPWAVGRYVVVNSGVTHREEHDRTNALQNPKLPDWAVVDITMPPTNDFVGNVVAADFFDESWQLRA